MAHPANGHVACIDLWPVPGPSLLKEALNIIAFTTGGGPHRRGPGAELVDEVKLKGS